VLTPNTYISGIKHIKTTNVKLDAGLIKELAQKTGFDACGITYATPLLEDNAFLDKWIDHGKNAEMHYLKNNRELRKNPEGLLDNAKSIISVLLSYNLGDDDTIDYYISKYARGLDYHRVVKKLLNAFVNSLMESYPELNARVFVDSAPVFERAYARNSGLGFIGKNTCLINPKLGSFVFIGEIICDMRSDYDSEISLDCGNCNLCVESCPVGALSDKGLDANRCISYHTIESKNDIPENIANKITNQVFGCDICQDVCPYNKRAQLSTNVEFKRNSLIEDLNIQYLENISNSQFNKKYEETAFNRVKREKLLKNFRLVERKKNFKLQDISNY